jgi:hypothetical protein
MSGPDINRPVELAIVAQSGALPKSTGVSVTTVVNTGI